MFSLLARNYGTDAGRCQRGLGHWVARVLTKGEIIVPQMTIIRQGGLRLMKAQPSCIDMANGTVRC